MDFNQTSLRGLYVNFTIISRQELDHSADFELDLMIFVTNERKRKMDPFPADGLLGLNYCPDQLRDYSFNF